MTTKLSESEIRSALRELTSGGSSAIFFIGRVHMSGNSRPVLSCRSLLGGFLGSARTPASRLTYLCPAATICESPWNFL
jgi:hypothetical protein